MRFEQIRKWVQDTYGDELAASRASKFDHYIASRMEQLGLMRQADYIAALTDPKEQQRLLDAITVPESYFYRFPQQLDAFFDFALPQLLHQQKPTEQLNLFCCACSTGEEAYTLAIMAHERKLDSRLAIYAGDINPNRVNFAKRGVYQGRTLNYMPKQWLELYFEREADSGSFQVKSQIKQLITWSACNLMADLPRPLQNGAPFDAIFCRNVLIYFNKQTVQLAMDNLHRYLKPDGLLALGHSERVTQHDKFKLERIDSGFFYRAISANNVTESSQQIVKKLLKDNKKITSRPSTKPILSPNPPIVKNNKPESQLAQKKLSIEEARALADKGQVNAAMVLCERALEQDPMQSEWQYLNGLLHLNQPETALECFRKAAYLQPDDPLAHYHLALCAEHLGQLKLATRSYNLAKQKLDALPPDSLLENNNGPTVAEFTASCEARLTGIEEKF